jgi:uncharacterized protein YciI
VAHFAVYREHGPAWDDSRPRSEQERWAEHAAFMNGLVAEGFVLLGGPLDGGPRVLLAVEAESPAAIEARLAADPWTAMGLLRIAGIEPWQILLGPAAVTGFA